MQQFILNTNYSSNIILDRDQAKSLLFNSAPHCDFMRRFRKRQKARISLLRRMHTNQLRVLDIIYVEWNTLSDDIGLVGKQEYFAFKEESYFYRRSFLVFFVTPEKFQQKCIIFYISSG
jgi:hypothetical protein